MTKSFIYCLIGLLAIANATAQSGSPREFGMGGTSVASADYLSAGFSNPALLTNYSTEYDDDWGLAVPNINLFASDRSNLIDAIDDFTQSFDKLEAGLSDLSTSPGDLQALADSLNNLSNKHFNIGLGAGVSIAIPSSAFSAAIVISTAIEADGFMDIDPADSGIITGAFGSLDIPEINSEAVLLASFRTELGLAMAKEFSLGDRTISFGITPKLQNIEILDLVVNAESSDGLDEQIDNDNRFTDDSVNLDLGMTAMLSDHMRIGLSARNLMGGDFAGLLGDYTYTLDPSITTGVAYVNGPLTIAADVDLTTTTRFQEITTDDSQFVRLGLETKWQWAQLRVGYLTDLEENYADMTTAGIGLSPFGVMHLDLAGAVGENSYGGSFALSFTF